MKDYDVLYPSAKTGKIVCIGNVRADSQRKALNMAKKTYGPTVTVELA